MQKPASLPQDLVDQNLARLSLLKQQLDCLSSGELRERVSTGCRPLDEALPGEPERSLETAIDKSAHQVLGGMQRGTVVEWLGTPATYFAILGAREAAHDGGLIVFVDRMRTFYPPAAKTLGIDFNRTVVVRPDNEKEELWALDQALRCAHIAAVVGWPQKIDNISFRRFQLAVERSGCLGILVRPSSMARQPSWADLRISVSPRQVINDAQSNWLINLNILRCRGKARKESLRLLIDDCTGEIHEAHVSHLASQLAHPTTAATTDHSVKRASA